MAPRAKKSRNEKDCGTLQIECNRISSIDKIWKSSEVEVAGVCWNASVYVRNQESRTGHKKLDIRFLSIEFECYDKDRIEADVTYWIAAATPFSRTAAILMSNHSHANDNYYVKICHDDIVEFDFVMDESNGLVHDDKLIIEIRIFNVKRDPNIENISNVLVCAAPQPFDFSKPIDFTNGADPRHDITFILRHRKIYAGKQILAAHSPKFADMFYHKNERECVLESIDAKEFLELLRVLYPSTNKITDYNVHYLLELAKLFQIKLIFDLADKFFISADYDDPEKLFYADKYGLPKLENHCFSAFATTNDMKFVKEKTLHYNQLSDPMKKKVLEKYVEISQ